jgi:Phage late-transcription coactivator
MATKEEKNKFSTDIEILASKLEITHMEAIMMYCEANALEPEVAGTLVNEMLRAKIEVEAQNLRYLPRSSSLPI